MRARQFTIEFNGETELEDWKRQLTDAIEHQDDDNALDPLEAHHGAAEEDQADSSELTISSLQTPVRAQSWSSSSKAFQSTL